MVKIKRTINICKLCNTNMKMFKKELNLHKTKKKCVVKQSTCMSKDDICRKENVLWSSSDTIKLLG